MNRLTNKADGKYYPIMNQYGYDNVRRDIYNKLGKLEDLEQDLGCPLDVVFKALKEGIVYEENNKFITDKCIALHFIAYEKEWALIYDIDFMYSHLLKDYKKTWWLKEDLSE